MADDEFSNAYFEADSTKTFACIPLNMVSSMHIESSDDGYWCAVFVTVSGKEYEQQGFHSCQSAINFCEAQMKEIAAYKKACALSTNQRKGDKIFFILVFFALALGVTVGLMKARELWLTL